MLMVYNVRSQYKERKEDVWTKLRRESAINVAL